MHDFFPELARRNFFSLLGIMGTLVPEAFFYSFLANFATRTASFIFFVSARNAESREKKASAFFSVGSALRSALLRRKFPNKKDNIKRKPLGPL